MKFEIGKQVVCIIDSHVNKNLDKYYRAGLISDKFKMHVNDVFTVSDIFYSTENELALRFSEINIILKSNGNKIAFTADGFRPCNDTDISCFTKILKNVPIVETNYANGNNQD